MKKFQFRLEAVARWRSAKLESEENRYRTLVSEDARLKREMEQLDEAAARERRAVSENTRISGTQLAYLHEFQVFAAREMIRLTAEKENLERQIAEQFQLVLKERQGVQLLDKLRQKALIEWNTEFHKELQLLADEAYNARMLALAREQRR
ncbi:MAG: hypothetical protein JST65_17305 [Acidobacteria bacterium]|nr:hypothetical protein [Acidobacteriota bacterium]